MPTRETITNKPFKFKPAPLEKPWRPQLINKGDLRDLVQHNRAIIAQVGDLFRKRLQARETLYRVSVPLSVGRGDAAKLGPEHFDYIRNWVRRNASPLKRYGAVYGAGCIIPTLQTWGILFNPRVELDLQLIVRFPVMTGVPETLLARAFDGRVKRIGSAQKLGTVLANLRDAVEYPDIRLDDHIRSRRDLKPRDLEKLDPVVKNMREVVRAVGVRRFWVYFGMRCDGGKIRLLDPSPKDQAVDRRVAADREAYLDGLAES